MNDKKMEIFKDVVDIKVSIAALTEKASSAHKRIDVNDKELDAVRKKGHDHAGIIQNLAANFHMLESTIVALSDNIKLQSADAKTIAQKTSANTIEMIKLQTKADIIIAMTGVFFAICTGVGGFIAWLVSKHFG